MLYYRYLFWESGGMVDTVDSKSAAGTRREGSIPSSPTYQPPFSGEVMFASWRHATREHTAPHFQSRDCVGSVDSMSISYSQLVKALYVEIGAGGHLGC